jgi:hypothetical protein
MILEARRQALIHRAKLYPYLHLGILQSSEFPTLSPSYRVCINEGEQEVRTKGV